MSDAVTYSRISAHADIIRAILESHHLQWMPHDMRLIYRRMIQDANRLEIMADKLSEAAQD